MIRSNILNQKIAKEAGIYFIDKGIRKVDNNPFGVYDYSRDGLEYHYIISRNYYENDDKFKDGIEDLMTLCGLKFTYTNLSYLFYPENTYTSTYSMFPNLLFCDSHVLHFI
jgi:hypothetical protein